MARFVTSYSSIRQSIHQSHQSIHPSIHHSIHPSIDPSINRSIHQSFHPLSSLHHPSIIQSINSNQSINRQFPTSFLLCCSSCRSYRSSCRSLCRSCRRSCRSLVPGKIKFPKSTTSDPQASVFHTHFPGTIGNFQNSLPRTPRGLCFPYTFSRNNWKDYNFSRKD